MSIIRGLLRVRNSFFLLFILFLCILTGVYAAAPLLIFGIPAAKFAWSIVSGALAAVTIWQAADALIKNLDEQISDLSNDIISLTRSKNNAWSDYERRRTKMKEWEKTAAERQTAYDTALSEEAAATTAVSNAKNSNEISSGYASSAQAEYMYHTASCYYCVGSMLCSEGQRVYDKWQGWLETSKRNYKTLDAAKRTLTAKTSARRLAGVGLSTANTNVTNWTTYANYSLTVWRNTKSSIETKGAELASKEVEREINNATLQEAKGQIDAAKATLDVAERDYPEAWSQAMEDSDLAAQVANVRSH